MSKYGQTTVKIVIYFSVSQISFKDFIAFCFKAKAEKLHQEALDKAQKIEAAELIALSAKAGESGKLFGTITTKKLAEELLNKTGIEVDRKSIILDNPINHIGSFVMTVKLSSKVKAKLNVEVTASETIKESIEIEEEQQQEA